MPDTQDCSGYSYELEIVKGNEPIFKAQFSVFTDIGALTLASLITLFKMFYPDAVVRTKICDDKPVFATPLFETIMKSYLMSHGTGSKFG